VSSWKGKNVTLKEKHLHAKKKPSFISAMFYKKNIHIKCDYLKKSDFFFLKNDFFKESLTNIPKVNKNVQLQLDVNKSRSIKLYTFETIFVAHNFRAKSK
jgi:hypothetical protein